jgi:hypothetical protein
MSLSEQEHRDLVASFPRARLVPVCSVAIVALGLVGVFGTIAAMNGPHSGGPDVLWIVLAGTGFLGALLAVLFLVQDVQKVRAASLALVAERLRLEHVLKPPKAQRTALYAPFTGLPMLRSGPRGVKLWFGGEVDGRRVDLIEHQYVVSTGKSAHTVTHTAAATPVPPAWPRVTLSSRHALASWWASMTGNTFKVENEAFNDRWIVKTESPDFVLLLLTPEVQEFLADAPSAESWHVGGGSLCWLVRKQLKPRDLPPPLARVAALRNLLPQELDVWEPS